MLGKLICRSHCPTCAQVHLRGSIKSTSIFSGLWNDEGIVEEGELGMEGWEGEKEGSTSAGENEENEVEAEHEDGGDESGGDEGGDEIEGEDG